LFCSFGTLNIDAARLIGSNDRAIVRHLYANLLGRRELFFFGTKKKKEKNRTLRREEGECGNVSARLIVMFSADG
jgi:hypothetical protein